MTETLSLPKIQTVIKKRRR